MKERNMFVRLRRFGLERLEDRINPFLFTVTNTADGGTGSLRQAITSANFLPSADDIVFDPTVFSSAKIIKLTSGELSIDGPLTITGPGGGLVTVSGNSASRAFNTTATLSTEPIFFSGLTFASCLSTAGSGGAVVVGDESVTFTACDFLNNISTTSGGALAATGTATITLTDCNFMNNDAQVNGGGILMSAGGTLSIDRCTISDGDAVTGDGGAISVGGKASASITIRNSTLSGNTANSGGAIALSNTIKGSLTIRNSTLTLNDADTGTGGAIARTAGVMTITVESSIVSGNTNAAAPDISSSGTVSVNFSAIGSGSGFLPSGSSGNNLANGLDLKLGPLANNFGLTKTHLPAVDSPVVNKGSNSTGLVFDQRSLGFPRSRGIGVDIGAVEARVDLLTSNVNDSGSGSLRQAIADANSWPGSDTIVFDAGFFATPRVISLTSGALPVVDLVTINGPGAQLVDVSGNQKSSVFQLASSTVIKGITISGASGAGVLVNGALATFNECTVTANSGGGISAIDGSVNLIRSLVSNNTGANGGAIYIIDTGALSTADLNLVSSSILGNKAINGGAIYAVDAQITAMDSTIANNVADGATGGVYLNGEPNSQIGYSASVSLVQCTISGNSGTFDGGALHLVQDFEASIVGCTISGNQSSSTVGGGILVSGKDGVLSLFSTVVSGNIGASAPDIFSPFALQMSYCAIGNSSGFSSTGTNNLPSGSNLKLGPLADNGGPTKTHKPASDSPLIDTGGSTKLTLDQRGVGYPRSMGLATDIGAVEFKDLIVRNTNDSGPGSLRDVVADASLAIDAVVTFDPTVFGTAQSITLTSGEIVIGGEMTIQGAGAALTTIDGNVAYRIFKIDVPGSKKAITINDLTLTHGKVNTGGSAIFLNDDNLTLNRVNVLDNYVFGVNKYYGGAIFVDSGSGALTITDSVLNGNTIGPSPNSDLSCGGAINLRGDSSVTIVRSSISDNSAGLSGGGIFFYELGNLTIIDSTISGNKANLNSILYGGGGVYGWNTTATIINSTISSNTARRGGAFYLGALNVGSGSYIYLRQSTVAYNQAVEAAFDGTFAENGSFIVEVTNTIVDDPGAGVFGVYDGNQTAVPGDVQLGPLADNGGPTKTHALLFGSNAIDAGGNSTLTYDQRGPGYPRHIGSKVDIGAIESPPTTPAKVAAVQINDGSAQRSLVTSITVDFNQPIFLPGDPVEAFALRRQLDTQDVDLAATVIGSSVTLTFTGGAINGNSLADGRYTLTVLASKVAYLDGNGDGTTGDNYVLIGTPTNGLFRLFGDADGNGIVSAIDFNAFRLAYGAAGPSFFDFNADNQVTAFDFNEFRLRYGVII